MWDFLLGHSQKVGEREHFLKSILADVAIHSLPFF